MENRLNKYWQNDRSNVLNELVSSYRIKYVICIPCGRQRFLELLMPHVIESKLADEIHLWYNPRNQEDSNYIRNEIHLMDDRCKVVERPNNQKPVWSIAEFHAIENDPNTVYLKVDDDDVWFENGAMDKIFRFRVEHPEYFVVSPLIINNGYCAYMLRDVLPLAQHEKKILEIESKSADINGVMWYKSGESAIKTHNFFMDNINNLDLFRVPNAEISHIRFSVNAISWFGIDHKMVPTRFVNCNDEQQISSDLPHLLGLKNCIMGDVLCSHYAFGPQIDEVDKTDILERYRQIV